jgi:hypothetical protein
MMDTDRAPWIGENRATPRAETSRYVPCPPDGVMCRSPRPSNQTAPSWGSPWACADVQGEASAGAGASPPPTEGIRALRIAEGLR